MGVLTRIDAEHDLPLPQPLEPLLTPPLPAPPLPERPVRGKS